MQVQPPHILGAEKLDTTVEGRKVKPISDTEFKKAMRNLFIPFVNERNKMGQLHTDEKDISKLCLEQRPHVVTDSSRKQFKMYLKEKLAKKFFDPREDDKVRRQNKLFFYGRLSNIKLSDMFYQKDIYSENELLDSGITQKTADNFAARNKDILTWSYDKKRREIIQKSISTDLFLTSKYRKDLRQVNLADSKRHHGSQQFGSTGQNDMAIDLKNFNPAPDNVFLTSKDSLWFKKAPVAIIRTSGTSSARDLTPKAPIRISKKRLQAKPSLIEQIKQLNQKKGCNSKKEQYYNEEYRKRLEKEKRELLGYIPSDRYNKKITEREIYQPMDELHQSAVRSKEKIISMMKATQPRDSPLYK